MSSKALRKVVFTVFIVLVLMVAALLAAAGQGVKPLVGETGTMLMCSVVLAAGAYFLRKYLA